MWTEFWSPTAGHWVHVDSCEAEVAKPLLYDRGWGKKQAYVIAFGPYGAEDVTRAYVDDWGECLQRRRAGHFWKDGLPPSERDLARVSHHCDLPGLRLARHTRSQHLHSFRPTRADRILLLTSSGPRY